MVWTPSGKHLIAGKWVDTDAKFSSAPVSGAKHSFAVAEKEHVLQAVEAAEEAFWSYGYSTRQERASFLLRIADEIEGRKADVVEIAHQESGLPVARLEGELGRTTGQLRLFAEHIVEGEYLDHRITPELKDRQPAPRPELQMIQRPIGPIAVFGASNFPLAFSTAGGDTAAALAAGCPVVFKGHPAHPGTGEIIAQAIDAAIKALNLPAGVFSLLQGESHEVGQQLALAPKVQAVAFTGSLKGGRALFDLCANRAVPIPFYGELGAINPVFVLPHKAAKEAAQVAKSWIASLTMGVGQFCTNPGIIIVPSANSQEFIASAVEAAEAVSEQTMLTEGIAETYRKEVESAQQLQGVEVLLSQTEVGQRQALPNLATCSAETFLANPQLTQEVFGPYGLVVVVDDIEQMHTLAKSLEGQLTCTLQIDQQDAEHVPALLRILERKAGRILSNDFPTGVEVCDAMVHGGPYPASTNFGATSVGTLAIRRFVRPVCYQNLSDFVELR